MEDNIGKPIWDTPSGDLGTIQEGRFYQLALYAHSELHPESTEGLYYTMIAGSLPDGIQCRRTGLIEGIPKAITSVQGVPLEVRENITSKFTVRVYSEKEVNGVDVPHRVADRTFTLTVAGADIPVWVTTPQDVKNHYDGEHISYQFEYDDPDPGDTHTFKLLSGELPKGTTLTENGLLSGVILPTADLPNTALAGFDITGSNFDEYPFDHSSKSSSKNYQFVVELSDGRSSAIQAFNIYVFSRDNLTTDITELTVDSDFITADSNTSRTPVLLTPAGDLGIVRHDNYFAYKFDAIDSDGDPIEFSLTTGEPGAFDAIGIGFDVTGTTFDSARLALPPGLAIDIDTGWFYGYIPAVGLTETTYTFGLQVKKKNDPTIISPITFYTITIIGNIDQNITWITPTRAGTLDNGQESIISIRAKTTEDRPLQYRLKSGSNSKLPQGLRLETSGNIVGTTSFQMFTLDGNSTTFDEVLGTRLDVAPTVFDRTYEFTVAASNPNANILVYKEFEIYVNLTHNLPYESIYIKAMPPEEDRELIYQLLDNHDIMRDDLIYRSDDPNFGISKDVRYVHAYGLQVGKLKDYVTALNLNHYRKSLTLSTIKLARAVDSDDNVLYDVVYAEMATDLVNQDGDSVSLEVTRSPFLELFETTSVLDSSKTAASTVTTADNSIITVDLGVDIPKNLTVDSNEILADTTFITADLDLKGDLVELLADNATLTADSTFYNATQESERLYRFEIQDHSDIDKVYPNSLENMRLRVIEEIGNYSEILPQWMKSTQEDGLVPGFVPAWVIAYANPGKGHELKYLIEQQYGGKLNKVNFIADRYEINKSQTYNWNTTDDQWILGQETTFNRYIKTRDLTFVSTVDYATKLGFSQMHNRTVSYVRALGGIDSVGLTVGDLNGKTIIFQKQEDFGWDDSSDDSTLLSIEQAFTRYLRNAEDTTEIIPGEEEQRDDSTVENQRMAIYTITINSVTEIITLSLTTQTQANDYVQILEGTEFRSAFLYYPTSSALGLRYVAWQTAIFNSSEQILFDGGSCRFISNKDTGNNGERYDKYVLYPKHNIIGNKDYIAL